MPIYSPADAAAFDAHGSRFHSYINGERGAETLCAWRLDVGPRVTGVAHRPSHEEVLLVLEGDLHITLDGVTREVSGGDVVHVPAGQEFKVDGGPHGASAWVTTTRGLTATMANGQTLTPPWGQ